MTSHPVHPLGSRARVLLSSVFGPYARDDEFGSRAVNPMELYHNQVTRVQGGFSLRMFHRSFGLMFIQSNLHAPTTLLDFPTIDRFIREITETDYDIIGIGAIIPNVGKVKEMCRLIRKHAPSSVIVVGGHVANTPGIEHRIDADHVVKGDGVRWFRTYLQQDVDAPIRHPHILSGFGTRIMGYSPKEKPEDTAAILIPSVGCPVGCNFCSTSALFGGKGNFVNFFETGDDLFRVMSEIETSLGVQAFFVLDENFLLHRTRALRLLELMEQHHKAWSLYVFSSARVVKSYTMEQLIGLGISWVWMGLEGQGSQYRKLNNVNTFGLVRSLQAGGIRVLGSSIIGMEEHTPENMDAVIDYAVRHNTVFHQFMLYTPNPGTPLYDMHLHRGTLLPEAEFPFADAHGQYRFNYRHAHIRDGEEEHLLARAFQTDFETNGPSLARLIRVSLDGFLANRSHPNPRIRRRVMREAAPFRTAYAGAVWAMAVRYRNDTAIHRQMEDLLRRIYGAFGIRARLTAPVIGRFLLHTLKREERRLKRGWTMEPACFCENTGTAPASEASTAVVDMNPAPLATAPVAGN